MKRLDCGRAFRGPLVALHVQGDALADVLGSSDRIDAALGLAEAAIAAFHSVAGGRQQPVVQEGQGLLPVGREQFVERAAHTLEAANTASELGQSGQGGLTPASPIKQPVDLVHDVAEGSQWREPSGDPLERLFLGDSQAVLNEQGAMIEQIGNPLLDSLGLAGLCPLGLRGPATWKSRLPGLEFLADLGHRVQHRLGDLFEDRKLADLMPRLGEERLEHHGIERRTIGRDPQDPQAASVQVCLERAEELADVALGRCLFQNPIRQPLKAVIVHEAQYAERAVVEFIGRQVAAERLEGFV